MFPGTITEHSETMALSERLATEVNSMFVKGKRLYTEVMAEAAEADAVLVLPTLSLGSFKNRLKSYLMVIQSKGGSTEWVPENFRLCIQNAKRKSPRLNTSTTVS